MDEKRQVEIVKLLLTTDKFIRKVVPPEPWCWPNTVDCFFAENKNEYKFSVCWNNFHNYVTVTAYGEGSSIWQPYKLLANFKTDNKEVIKYASSFFVSRWGSFIPDTPYNEEEFLDIFERATL